MLMACMSMNRAFSGILKANQICAILSSVPLEQLNKPENQIPTCIPFFSNFT